MQHEQGIFRQATRWHHGALYNVTPSLPFTNAAECRNSYSIFRGSYSAATSIASDVAYYISSKLGVAISLTTGDCSMRDGIRPVSFCVAPIKIVGDIVRRISVFVADDCAFILRRLQKSFCNQAMHDFSLNLGVSANRNLLVTINLRALREHLHWPAALVGSGSFNPPQIRCRIVRRGRYYFPNFHSCNMARNKNKVNIGGNYVI